MPRAQSTNLRAPRSRESDSAPQFCEDSSLFSDKIDAAIEWLDDESDGVSDVIFQHSKKVFSCSNADDH